MNTEQEIKRIALEVTPWYAYGTFYKLNTITDRMRARQQMPACLHLQTSSGSVSFSDGAYLTREKGTSRVQVGFADAVRLDQDPELTIPVVERLIGMCSELVNRMNASGLWEPIDGYDYEVLYNTQDGNLVLVLASFDARELDGKCVDL